MTSKVVGQPEALRTTDGAIGLRPFNSFSNSSSGFLLLHRQQPPGSAVNHLLGEAVLVSKT